MSYDTPVSLNEEEQKRFNQFWAKPELTESERKELERLYRKDEECVKQDTLNPVY